jgi:hypothetical protein
MDPYQIGYEIGRTGDNPDGDPKSATFARYWLGYLDGLIAAVQAVADKLPYRPYAKRIPRLPRHQF